MRTIFSVSSLARASLVTLALAASAAHAVDVTVTSGNTTTVGGIDYTLNPLNNSEWHFSENATGLMSVLAAHITTTGTLKTTPDEFDFFGSIKVGLPVNKATGDSLKLGADTYYATKSYSHAGSLTIEVPKKFPSGRRNAATVEGGSLTISNLSVDLPSLRVFADVTGGNGVGSISQLALWDITSHTNGGMLVTAPYASVGAVASLTGLNLTTAGYDVFAQSLSLSNLGKAALSSVGNFGTLTTAVPEPSTWALVVAGMVGIGALKRRRATTH